MGPTILSNPCHVIALKNFSKNLSIIFPDLIDEMKMAFPIYFPERLTDGKPDWVALKMHPTSLPAVCRIINRFLVGDLCRHPDWIDINVKYTMDVVIGAQIISLFPEFLQPWGVFITRCLDTDLLSP
jgi:hypothetical protein